MTDHRRILITGATGAIGPTLCASLLADNPKQHLAIAMRADEQSVAQRFEEYCGMLDSVFAEREIDAPRWRERIVPVEMTVCADGLGLTSSTRRELLGQVDQIIHAAADTRFASSPDEQFNINVEGTRRILEFAREAKHQPRVILVSTVCTSGRSTGRIMETPLHPQPVFVNNYERTKWLAEELALASDQRVAIARVSIVLGSASGTVHRAGAVHHLLRWFGRGLIPVLPGIHGSRLDVVSTEFVGDFLARAAASDWPDKSIWNVAAGDDASHFREFCEICWEMLRPGETMENIDRPGEPFLVEEAEFDRVREVRVGRGYRVSQQAMNSISSFAPMLACPRVYDRSTAKSIWKQSFPTQDWQSVLRNVLRPLQRIESAEAIAA